MADFTVTNSHFGLSIDSLTGGGDIGRFLKVSGLSVKQETLPVVEGGQNQFVHQLPGPFKWTDLSLERGLISSNALFDWLMDSSGDGLAAANNIVKRHTGAITLYSEDGQSELRKWKFSGAFPVSWTGPDFDASAEVITTEKLVLAHEGLVPE